MQTFSSTAVSCFLLLSAIPHFSQAAEKIYQLKVEAGAWDRHQSVVVFDLPGGAERTQQLRDDEGRLVPVQVDERKQASFILQNLARNSVRTYQLVTSRPEVSPGLVQVTRAGAKLRISNSGKPVLEYQTEPGDLPRPDIKPLFRRGGYLHPVMSPSGKAVTDDYPPNHIHHHGIWFPWTKTEFEGRHPDFWNMGEGKGTVEFVALGETWNGSVHGGFTTRHRFMDLTGGEPKAALNETWEVRIFKTGSGTNGKVFWMFDLVSTQECASSSPLILPKFYYGGLGFRGNWQWNGKEKAFFLTSEGETDRVKGNETRGRWCHIGGIVDGQLTGIAILCHPANFRAPQPMRLHPGEPFFCFAPSQLGDWKINPGKPYVSRYRFIVQDGAPDRAELDRLWNDYAHPPEAKVE